MRKRLIPRVASIVSLPDESYLDLDRVASVEVTSEEKDSRLVGKPEVVQKMGFERPYPAKGARSSLGDRN
jgi:hypothetical protein